MDGYRIRRGGLERRVADAAALKALVAAGGVRAGDEINTPDGWIPVEKHPLLRGALRAADPWAAWSDVESVDAASLYKKMVDAPPAEEEVSELPVEALTPVYEAPAPRPAPEAEITAPPARPSAPPVSPSATPVSPSAPQGGPSPAPVVSPTVAPPSVEPPRSPEPAPESRPAHEAGLPRGPRSLADGRSARPSTAPPLLQPVPEDGAEVIDFPRARPAPPPVPELLLARPPRARSGPPPIVRTSRVVAMVLGGLSIVLLAYAWIRMGAYTGFGEGTQTARAATRSTTTAPPKDPLIELDRELRGALPTHPRDVKEPGDLSDALLVELMQQRLEIVSADGLVTKWVGKKGDEPKTAEVRIAYKSGGDLSRELGAIALVVGRYKRFYRLDMPVFEVTELNARGVTKIDANDAEAFYQARMSLEALLTKLLQK